jgi:hypothetical protein
LVHLNEPIPSIVEHAGCPNGRSATPPANQRTFVRQQNYENPLAAAFAVLATTLASLTHTQAQDPLPLWNDGLAKQAVVNFVQTTTETGRTNFVPAEERIDSTHARILTAFQLHFHP